MPAGSSLKFWRQQKGSLHAVSLYGTLPWRTDMGMLIITCTQLNARCCCNRDVTLQTQRSRCQILAA